MGRLVRVGAPDALADFYDSPSHIFGSGEDGVVQISTKHFWVIIISLPIIFLFYFLNNSGPSPPIIRNIS